MDKLCILIPETLEFLVVILLIKVLDLQSPVVTQRGRHAPAGIRDMGI